MNVSALIATVTFALLAAPAAAADPTPESASAAPRNDAAAEARRITQEGLELFEQQRYDEAIARFKAAHATFPVHGLLYNLAQAERLKGDLATAAKTYREFLEHEPEGPLSELARQHLAACEEHSNERSSEVASPAPKTAASPAKSATVMLPPPNWLEPGREREPASRDEHPGRTAAVVSFASSGVFLGLGAYFGLRASRASSVVSDVFEERGQWSDRADQIERDGKRDEKLALAATITGAVAAGLGVWFWTW